MKWAMQIDVPCSEYGECTFIMPVILQAWLVKRALRGKFCGTQSWGDGYTNGVTNVTATYMVYNIDEEDASAFKLMFPKCKVHVCESL